ncbi:MAG TPA: acyl-CoA dehydrogenase family protein [Micromonosporaceae bacterium]
MTDLLYAELEQEVRGNVRHLLEQRAPLSRMMSRLDSAESDGRALAPSESYDRSLWRSLATEMGLAGMAVPEQLGGAGASWRETAVVLEELGRSVAPVPFLSSAVVATAALLHISRADLLAQLAAGDRIAVLAVPFSAGPAVPAPTVSVVDGRLTGQVTSVADGLAADLMLVPVPDGLYLVEADAAGVSRSAVTTLDMTRPLADLSLTGVTGSLVCAGADATEAVATGLTVGAALLASEQLGLADWCLSTTVEYVKVRHQFGRPVGSFQALKHRLADLWVDLTQARAVARYAAGCAAAGDPDLPLAAALAQAFCAPVAVKAAEECVQLHGGIGFTWEHPAHHYLKRAKSAALALGTPDQHRARLAGLVDLPV